MPDPNLPLLEDAVRKLAPFLDEIVFVGGVTLGLLITDKAAAPIRGTNDVDVIAEIVTYADLSVVFGAVGPGVSPATRKLRDVRYSIRKSTGGVSLAALAPALINSIVTCCPDLVAISRFDCAGSLVMGLT